MNAESSVHNLVIAWHEIFGSTPAHPRYIVELAFYGSAQGLRESLLGILPSLDKGPHHSIINNWLKQQENIPLVTDDERRFRFVRKGHSWMLVPIHDANISVQEPIHAM